MNSCFEPVEQAVYLYDESVPAEVFGSLLKGDIALVGVLEICQVFDDP